MVTAQEIRSYIEQLADREHQHGQVFLEAIQNRRWSQKTNEEYAQLALVFDENDQLKNRLHGELGQWGNCPPIIPNAKYGVSVLQLLLYHPVLFVDFGAWDKNEFERRYGVTASQMSKLAKEGLVIPSLYWYDSYSQQVREKKRST